MAANFKLRLLFLLGIKRSNSNISVTQFLYNKIPVYCGISD